MATLKDCMMRKDDESGKPDLNRMDQITGEVVPIYSYGHFHCLDPVTNELYDQATSCNASIPARTAGDEHMKSKRQNVPQR